MVFFFFFFFFITDQFSLNFHYSSLNTHHIKYPNFLYPTCLAHVFSFSSLNFFYFLWNPYLSTMSGIPVSLPASHRFIISYHLLFISFSLQPYYSPKTRDFKTPFMDSPSLATTTTKGRRRTPPPPPPQSPPLWAKPKLTASKTQTHSEKTHSHNQQTPPTTNPSTIHHSPQTHRNKSKQPHHHTQIRITTYPYPNWKNQNNHIPYPNQNNYTYHQTNQPTNHHHWKSKEHHPQTSNSDHRCCRNTTLKTQTPTINTIK